MQLLRVLSIEKLPAYGCTFKLSSYSISAASLKVNLLLNLHIYCSTMANANLMIGVLSLALR